MTKHASLAENDANVWPYRLARQFIVDFFLGEIGGNPIY